MAETISRYEIVRELGRGGMAIVYLARDPLMDRQVAVKVLPRQFTFDPGFRSRFQREAQIVARLEHPAIVPVYDFGEFDDQPFLVMRYMAGGSLRGRLADKPLPVTEVAGLYNRLAAGLDKAHRQSVIHRDIKPDNVLFDDEGLPYLADFGIARLAEASQTMTVAGTPTYMSPEQVHGKQTLDGRADIYALGVMLFELLTGRPPYEANTNAQLMFKHAYEPVPDVLAANPTLPAGAREVIVRSMAKAPADRYRTAAELAMAVQWLAGRTPAGPITPTLPPAGDTTLLDSPPPAALPQVEIDVPPQKEQPKAAAERTAQMARVRPAATPQQPPAKAYVPPQEERPEAVVERTPLRPAGAAQQLPVQVDAPLGNEEPGDKLPFALPVAVWIGGGLILALALLLFLGLSVFRGRWSVVVASRLPMSATPIATQTRPGDGMVMVYVPEGSFLMGSADGDLDAYDSEFPQHQVTLDAFWLDQTEVTNGQYERCVADGECRANYDYGSDFTGENQPVVGVSWDDAADYCAWAGGQLPTEAQWEYAARGPESLTYPWGDSAPDLTLLNYDWNVGRTTDVGSYPAGASWVGVLDMAGNVYEWVADWYDAD